MIMFKNAKEYFDENGCSPLGWTICVKTNSRAKESEGQAYKAMHAASCLLSFSLQLSCSPQQQFLQLGFKDAGKALLFKT